MCSVDRVRLKIDRAREHYEAVKVQLADFSVINHDAIVSDVDRELQRKIWRVVKPLIVPPTLPAIVGDAVHNLRSALDHLAWQLVLAGCGEPNERTAFPIFTDETSYLVGRDGRRPGRQRLHGMSADAKALIDEMQPYHGLRRYRDAMLIAIDELNNIDKHRYLNVLLAGQHGGSFRGHTQPLTAGTYFIHFGPLKHDTVAAWIALEEDVDVDFVPALDVAFAERLPLWRPDQFLIRYILLGAADIVEHFIDKCERVCF